jgi:hypothetical protein
MYLGYLNILNKRLNTSHQLPRLRYRLIQPSRIFSTRRSEIGLAAAAAVNFFGQFAHHIARV